MSCFQIERIVTHPDYDDNPSDPNFRADIALIKLAEDAVWSDTIGPVCLPGINETVVKKDAIIAGWGQEEKMMKMPLNDDDFLETPDRPKKGVDPQK